MLGINYKMVEAGGIEPPSQSQSEQASTYVAVRLVLAYRVRLSAPKPASQSDCSRSKAPQTETLRTQPIGGYTSSRQRAQRERRVAQLLSGESHFMVGSYWFA